MKPATPLCGLLSYLPSVFATLSLGVASCGLLGQASAEAVDSELVLLVDVSRSGLNNRDFSSLMKSYAASFTSSQALSSIQSGTYGRIAVSMMFYGNTSVQQIAIPWMSIGDASDAARFATLISNVARPASSAASNVPAALAAAVTSFGSETGGTANSFESTVQVISFAATTVPGTAGLVGAGNAALAAGVDSISAITLGNSNRAGQIATAFNTGVVGSALPGLSPSATPTPVNGALTAALTLEVTSSIARGVTVVPEPGSLASLMAGLGFTLLLRRRS